MDSVTYEMDRELGTEYHARFRRYLRHVQEHDLVVDGAMTDAKGDRRLRPSQQADPDLFVHIVERRPDGIVVRGAKLHQTGALNAHEIIVMPTQTLSGEDEDYAVAFGVPADAPGILMVCGRQPSDTRRLEGGRNDVGNRELGGHEAGCSLSGLPATIARAMGMQGRRRRRGDWRGTVAGSIPGHGGGLAR